MKRKHPRLNFIHLAAAAVPLLLIGIICALAGKLDAGSQKEQELALSNALEHAVTMCYALEGIYPPDLQYMKEHYGLTYNEERFYVSYRPIASNIRPEYNILELDGKASDLQSMAAAAKQKKEQP